MPVTTLSDSGRLSAVVRRRGVRGRIARRASFPRCQPPARLVFLGLAEQPGLNRSGCPLSLHIIMGETASPEDYGAGLRDAAATSVVEVHKRKAGTGHRILQERDRRCRRQAMLTAQVQQSADEAVAAVPVVEPFFLDHTAAQGRGD